MVGNNQAEESSINPTHFLPSDILENEPWNHSSIESLAINRSQPLLLRDESASTPLIQQSPRIPSGVPHSTMVAACSSVVITAVPLKPRPASLGKSGHVIKKKRAHAEILEKRLENLPGGFPSGPWATFDEAFEEISRCCKNKNTMGGAWSVNKTNKRVATSRCGEKRDIVCALHKSPKPAMGDIRERGSFATACKWRISLEQSEEGWVIFSLPCLEHNHGLATTDAEAIANPGLREIPEDLVAVGEFMKECFRSPDDINK